MKTSLVVIFCLALGVLNLSAQQAAPAVSTDATSPTDPLPQPTSFHVVGSGADYKIWQRETFEHAPDGKAVTRIHKYTELAAGLCYQDANANWVDSKEVIEGFPGGAVAQQGNYHVIFANNLNSSGSIDMQARDGNRLRSNILGLGYYDRSTGNSILIAQLQDSAGELIAANQVLYTNAFSGLNADVRYSYRKGSFEQDVILREQPPSPEVYGLNPETTEIEVLTEFLNPPQETIVEKNEAGNPDSDQDISWGATRLGHGKAFDLGAENDFRAKVSVKRHYATVNGRKILFERVPLSNLQAGLQKLPAHAAIKSRLLRTASKELMLPQTPLAQTTTQPMRLADIAPSLQGYVLDYVEINTNQGNYVFQADTTYYLSGYNYFDSVMLEGGTVLKYAVNAAIDNWGSVTCQTGPYRPAILTAVDDNTVGEPIPGSTGTPSGYYADFAIKEEGAAGSYQNLRIAYATHGLILSSSNTVSDCQFINDAYALDCYDNPSVQVNNSLFWQDNTVFDDSVAGFPAGAVNITVHDVGKLAGSSVTLGITNSLLVSVTNWGATFTGAYCATNTDADGIFQVAGAASHYLATGSSYRNAGIRNMDPLVVADLATKTTYPPVIYSNTPVAGGTFSPSVQRDTNSTPDLGYHYDPLDYCFGGVNAPTNAVFTFTAGTSVGWFEPPSELYGISLPDAASVNYGGTVTAPCVQARYSTVQEGGNGNWPDMGGLGCMDAFGSAPYNQSIAAVINARFTLFACHAWQPSVGQADTSDIIFNFTHCVVNSGQVSSYVDQLCFTNCLLLGTVPGVQDAGWSGAASLNLQNCTMREGRVISAHFGSSTWPINIRNCAFENVDFSQMTSDGETTDTNVTYCDYNAYVTNQDRLPLAGTHDLTVTNFNWQRSWLGNYYLPANSPLINTGSITADLVGLYHFTTQTNQVKETNSIVDIGYHYVATDAFGNPIDSNGDGIPDYLEDANGNGLLDGGETNWALGILMQPTNLLANVGTSPALNVSVAGVAPFSYLWYSNAIPLSTATNSTLVFNNVQTNCAGNYYVVITNNVGAVTSSIATLSIVLPPTVTITNPINNTATSATNVTLQATATDIAGSITVTFYQGTNSLGSVPNLPYSLVWSNVPSGNYVLTAVATDNGLSTTSAPVNITVAPMFTTNSMRLWLKADAIAGLTNNAPIATWSDSSGWGNDATQPDPNNKPAYITNALNGCPIVRFDGSHGFLNLPNCMGGATSGQAYIVLKTTTPLGTIGSLWSLGTYAWAPGDGSPPEYPLSDGNISDVFGSSVIHYLGHPVPLSQYHLFEVMSETNNWSGWINGMLEYQTTNNAVSFNNGTSYFGKDNFNIFQFAGDVAEVLVFNQALTNGEANVVEQYLNQKYSLITASPTGPAFLTATAASLSQINLNWVNTTTVPAEVMVERKTDLSGTYAVIATLSSGVTNYSDTGLAPGHVYYYRTRAWDLAGYSPYSNEAGALLDTLPVVSLTTPTNGSLYVSPTNLSLTATATSSYSTIASVEFLANGTNILGTVTNAPYTLIWSNVLHGIYALSVVATDVLGISSNSPSVTVTVSNIPPVVTITSPTNGNVFVAPANITLTATASDTNGSVAKVDFFYSVTNFIGEVTNSPYTAPWTNVYRGTYALTAVAMDNEGAFTTSSVVTVTVSNLPPTVSILSPTNNALFQAPANIPLTVNAQSTYGYVAKVDYYYNATNLIGESTTSPFSLVWNNVAAGTNSITATATDNEGSTTTSSAITNVVVNAQPTVTITNPVNNAYFTSSPNITINATASDADGSVSQVSFYYANTNYLIGSKTSSPYSIVLSNAPPGTYSLVAKALDGRGGVGFSSPITINVATNLGDVADSYDDRSHPASNFGTVSNLLVQTNSTTDDDAWFKFDTTGTPNVTSAKLNISAVTSKNNATIGVTLYTTGTNWTETGIAWSNQPALGTILGNTNISGTSPTWYVIDVTSYVQSQKTAGSNVVSFAVHATNANAQSVSISSKEAPSGQPFLQIYNTNTPPMVSITSPTNYAVFAPSTNISIVAAASTGNGSIFQVQIFADSTSLGILTNSSSYSMTWSNVPPGAHALTAIATDNLGYQTVSSPVYVLNDTSPDTTDSSGDGIPDGWKAIWGLNPTINNWSQSSQRANYLYTPADWFNQVSGTKTGSVNLDNEGNVLQVSQ